MHFFIYILYILKFQFFNTWFVYLRRLLSSSKFHLHQHQKRKLRLSLCFLFSLHEDILSWWDNVIAYIDADRIETGIASRSPGTRSSSRLGSWIEDSANLSRARYRSVGPGTKLQLWDILVNVVNENEPEKSRNTYRGGVRERDSYTASVACYYGVFMVCLYRCAEIHWRLYLVSALILESLSFIS